MAFVNRQWIVSVLSNEAAVRGLEFMKLVVALTRQLSIRVLSAH